jgi:hypothetical protein
VSWVFLKAKMMVSFQKFSSLICAICPIIISYVHINVQFDEFYAQKMRCFLLPDPHCDEATRHSCKIGISIQDQGFWND